jgi:2-oxoglutarate dehydrogenase E2 component (dihydrolipoamide succinyltransferase)
LGSWNLKVENTTSLTVAAVEKTVSCKEAVSVPQNFADSDKFFSPLVKISERREAVSVSELESITSSGKKDVLLKRIF